MLIKEASNRRNKRRRANLDCFKAAYLVLLGLAVWHVQLIACKSLEPILWSVQNKMFETKYSRAEESRGEHIIEVRIGEFLNILCPKYALNSANTIEYHALHQVSKEEYSGCKIREIHAKHPILRCDRPFENVKYTLYIAKFSPVPDAIEFTPGNSYYFISTSNGTYNGLNNHENGTCLTNNMKIIIKVLDSKASTRTSTEAISSSSWSTSTSTRASSTASHSHYINENAAENYYDYLIRKKQHHSTTASSVLITKLRSVTFSPTLAFDSTKMTKPSTSAVTVPTTTTATTKTVNDNIFILEPDSIDYNDILSQLIFSSSSHSSPLSSSDSSLSSSQSSSLNSETNSDSRNGDEESDSELLNSFSSNKSNTKFAFPTIRFILLFSHLFTIFLYK